MHIVYKIPVQYGYEMRWNDVGLVKEVKAAFLKSCCRLSVHPFEFGKPEQ